MFRDIGVAVAVALAACGAPAEAVSFAQGDGALEIRIGDAPFATYIYDGAKMTRPFFANVHAPNGTRVTRAFPAGPDDDHGDMHPGLWMSFGDLNGHDFWRNKAQTKHLRFSEPPTVASNVGTFAVDNAYLSAGGELIAHERARYSIQAVPEGILLLWTSEFLSPTTPLNFGDQEEMGLGVRVRPEISVDGGGNIRNAAGAENEAGVWGKPADFASYSGTIDGEGVGVAIKNHPENFRTPWWHARDYGLLVANPFGRNAMTAGEKSQIRVETGQTLTLRYAVLIYTGTPDIEGYPHQRPER